MAFLHRDPGDRARLAPLMLAAMSSQALIVVLAPTIGATAADLGTSVSTVGQARSVAAGTAIATSLLVARRIDTVPISRLLGVGAGLAAIGSAAVAAAPTLAAFLVAHVLVGIALACLVSAGFAGAAAFPPERRGWAVGYVVGANALAWIVVTPVAGFLADRISWRVAEVVPVTIALAATAAAPLAADAPRPQGVPGLGTLLSQGSARRWTFAEVIAFVAWAALLTFVGAFFVEGLALDAAVVGWILAAGAAAHFVASTRLARFANAIPRRRIVAAAALVMALLSVAEFAVRTPALAAAVFCLLGLAAGIRSTTATGLGLEQLPEHPGAMMAARAAATQVGYLLGAAIGGAVIAGPGYGALGIVLAAGMATSAWLVLRVEDPLERAPISAVGAPRRTAP